MTRVNTVKQGSVLRDAQQAGGILLTLGGGSRSLKSMAPSQTVALWSPDLWLRRLPVTDHSAFCCGAKHPPWTEGEEWCPNLGVLCYSEAIKAKAAARASRPETVRVKAEVIEGQMARTSNRRPLQL